MTFIWTKKCKKCGDPFDIDTSQELCPECRNGFKINWRGEDDMPPM